MLLIHPLDVGFWSSYSESSRRSGHLLRRSPPAFTTLQPVERDPDDSLSSARASGGSSGLRNAAPLRRMAGPSSRPSAELRRALRRVPGHVVLCRSPPCPRQLREHLPRRSAPPQPLVPAATSPDSSLLQCLCRRRSLFIYFVSLV